MSHIKIYAPIRKRMILVFDVETTGLLPKKLRAKKGEQVSEQAIGQGSETEIPIESYPYIIQLSFVLYDIIESRAVYTYDSYIRLPEHVEIPDTVSELTGITKQMCNEKGKNIIEVLDNFYEAYMLAEIIVAHNIEFDEKMISVELQRNREQILDTAPYCFTIFSKIYEKLKGVQRYCTMRNGTELCAITVESKTTKKWPRLSELHQKLFDEVPDGLHNSMVDVNACLKCYLKMRHGIN
jgi:DNA polymerase III epsilon subunit-like protein